jgi:hypothetical protein
LLADEEAFGTVFPGGFGAKDVCLSEGSAGLGKEMGQVGAFQDFGDPEAAGPYPPGSEVEATFYEGSRARLVDDLLACREGRHI